MMYQSQKKRITFLLLAITLLLLFTFSSCVDMKKIGLPATDDDPQSAQGEKLTEAPFKVQYIRTDGGLENNKDPNLIYIRSPKELNDYYELNRKIYSLEKREDPASDSTIGFLNACHRYDEKYFEEHILLMVILEEPSGSVRHKVEKVMSAKEKLEVYIEKSVPEAFTQDMADWHILIELHKNIAVTEDKTAVFIDGIDPRKTDTIVHHSKGYADISLDLPYDWKYELEDGEDKKSFCIAISPEKEIRGKLKIWYYNAFGVCGTGLKEEKIKLGKYEAYMGKYAGDKLWSFISFLDLPGQYVVINEGAEAWWDDYGEKAMGILENLTLAEDVIPESEAIRIAKENTKASFDFSRADFDSESGVWTVTLYNQNSQDGIYVCTVTSEGKFLNLAIGDGKENK